MNGHHKENGKASSNTTTENYSDLQLSRLRYVPGTPATLQGPFVVKEKPALPPVGDHEKLKQIFPNIIKRKAVELLHCSEAWAAETKEPLTVGIVLSGGQAPGGHNVIAGLFDHLQSQHPGSRLLGFLNGPRGILQADYKEITAQEMDNYRNQGGFHMICAGRDKIEKADDLKRAAATAQHLKLDGLVVVGGDDSNTNAAVLAEYFVAQGLSTSVLGVPKTIDGDLKNSSVAVSFGFDTACKIYSEAIGNIMTDAASARKYWHFVRLMGRAASHITLECALQTHPQLALISEEVAHRSMGLSDLTNQVADIVEARSAAGKDFGVVLLPEGLIEFVPEVGSLIAEINELLAANPDHDAARVSTGLTEKSRQVFQLLPEELKQQLLLDRDPHGNVQVAKIETERLLVELVDAEVARRKAAGKFRGKFNALTHYLGYEGRSGLPSNFDSTYCYSLGHAAGALLGARQTGLMATLSRLNLPTLEWGVGGTPLPSMMAIERRKGADKPVISKALVVLDGEPFRYFQARRDEWATGDCFRSPGPIQFFGGGVADYATKTLDLEINGGLPIRIC